MGKKKTAGQDTKAVKSDPTAGEKSGNSKSRSSLKDEETGFLVEAAINIESSARKVGKKAGEVTEKLGDQAAEIAGKVFDTIKKGVTESYETSSRAIEDLAGKAGDYLKKFETSVEMRKLREKKDQLSEKLGGQIYTVSRKKNISIEKMLSDKSIQPLLQEMIVLHKEILKLGRKMSASK